MSCFGQLRNPLQKGKSRALCVQNWGTLMWISCLVPPEQKAYLQSFELRSPSHLRSYTVACLPPNEHPLKKRGGRCKKEEVSGPIAGFGWAPFTHGLRASWAGHSSEVLRGQMAPTLHAGPADVPGKSYMEPYGGWTKSISHRLSETLKRLGSPVNTNDRKPWFQSGANESSISREPPGPCKAFGFHLG